MSKRKKVAKQSSSVSNSTAGQLAGSPIMGTYVHVLFIDRNSEITDAKVEELEEAGFHVVLVNGEPSRTVHQVSLYKQ